MSTYRQDTDNKSFFTKVDTYHGAVAMTRVTAKVFAIVGALQLLTALFTLSIIRSPAIFFDCVVNLACAYCIYRFHSRIASLVALTLAAVTLLFALVGGVGPIAIMFSLLAMWGGARALEATVKLHASLASPPCPSRTLKNFAFALLTVISAFAVIYSLAVLPPSRTEQNMARHMEIDVFALMNRDRVKVLQEDSVARYGFVTMVVIVSQQGWGTVLKPGTEELLLVRGWKKYQGRNDVYCKEGAQLSFTQTMHKNEGAVRVNMIYDHSSQQACEAERGT
ncbi:hypothetical protein GN109_13100 [Collimonas pratensis]|uniref:Uncharacterized protein n=1 Tax=Collimonas pratensis TaxID=279113 RepID=A0A127Q7V8_9BURK|nr:hypothetical protein [Collimonas pratensis]AMP06076.1 hypothetical protein CPter91_3755 [Collimonas pratensis]NKI70359.1 hypothetical protein [Collimonas pratensis]